MTTDNASIPTSVELPMSDDSDVVCAQNEECSADSTMNKNDRSSEKRPRLEKSDESSEDGFTPVTRPKKKTMRKDLLVFANTNGMITHTEDSGDNCFEVCLTAEQPLPKQMALAKLLRDENSKTIDRIKYKNPYKVFIQFRDRKCAESLLNCQKLTQLGIRTQFTDEGNLSYGLVKGVDLDINDQEIITSFSCPAEIAAVRRLKRIDGEGKWVDCETIRFCFKSPICPEYVYAYGCKFEVERYVFPVTQCSRCWKFGHPRKFCPRNKIFCPKCGGEHENCETNTLKCLNCKGQHLALDKTCPHYTKEKKIRVIMSEQNIPYKKALEVFIEVNKAIKYANLNQDYNTNYPSLRTSNATQKIKAMSASRQPSATGVALNSELIWSNLDVEDNIIEEERESTILPSCWNKNQKKNNQNNTKRRLDTENGEMELETPMEDDYFSGSVNEPVAEQEAKRKQWKLEWKNIFDKMKGIVFSGEKLEDKLVLIGKVILAEIKKFVMNMFTEGDLMNKFFGLING